VLTVNVSSPIDSCHPCSVLSTDTGPTAHWTGCYPSLGMSTRRHWS
jgi:hypothetical protein